MPEEVENLEDENNDAVSSNSSNSSLKSAAGNVASNIVDFNKYKSRKNNKANIDSNSTKNNAGNSLKSSLLNKGKSAVNGLKNKAGNAVLNKVANAHPALKALSVLNNLNKTRKNGKKKKPGIIGGENQSNENNSESIIDSGSNTNNEGTDYTNEGTDYTNEDEGKSSFNPLSSILGGSNFLGKFSFFGRISLPVKMAMIGGVGLFGTLIFAIIPALVVIGWFNGLFGADDSLAIGTSGGVGNIDYGNYELVSDGDEILNQALDVFLESHGSSLEEFNNLIASNVEDSGYGTRAGVVAAAVTLIAELGNNYNVKIPYFWGGGHGQMIEGAASNWGSGRCFTSANGQAYTACGLDCSGFITWALYNGGFDVAARSAGSFQNLSGAERVTLEDSAILEPGDLLESNSHIVLVIGVDEDEYICAEASSRTTGVLFTRRPFTKSGYWGVKMDGFYNTQARS